MKYIHHIMSNSDSDTVDLNTAQIIYTLCYHLPEYYHIVSIPKTPNPDILYYLQFIGCNVYITNKNIQSDIGINYYHIRSHNATTLLFNTPKNTSIDAKSIHIDKNLVSRLELAIGDYMFRLKHLEGNNNIILEGEDTLNLKNTIRLALDPRIRYRQLLSSKAYVSTGNVNRTVLEAAALKIPIITKKDTDIYNLFGESVLTYTANDDVTSILNTGLVDENRITNASVVAEQYNMRIFINEFKTYLQ